MVLKLFKVSEVKKANCNGRKIMAYAGQGKKGAKNLVEGKWQAIKFNIEGAPNIIIENILTNNLRNKN